MLENQVEIEYNPIYSVLIKLHILWVKMDFISNQIRSDQISRSVDSLRPHESQHARPPCPSPTPGVHSDSCPSSQ